LRHCGRRRHHDSRCTGPKLGPKRHTWARSPPPRRRAVGKPAERKLLKIGHPQLQENERLHLLSSVPRLAPLRSCPAESHQSQATSSLLIAACRSHDFALQSTQWHRGPSALLIRALAAAFTSAGCLRCGGRFGGYVGGSGGVADATAITLSIAQHTSVASASDIVGWHKNASEVSPSCT
jgi:hypothetical protein